MACLLITLIVAVLALANAAVVRQLQRRHAGRWWWAALFVAWLAGAALGGWGFFFVEYQPSPRLRVVGAPLPAASFLLEGPPGEEQWVDYVTPAAPLLAAANVLILALLAGCPVGLVFWLVRWAGRAPAPARTTRPPR